IGLRVSVPGTNILADVAAKNVVPDLVSKLNRYLALLLDSQVRDAPRGIHLVWRSQRICRASVDATRTRAASVRRRSHSRNLFVVQPDRREYGSQEQPRSVVLIDHAGVLPQPADA